MEETITISRASYDLLKQKEKFLEDKTIEIGNRGLAEAFCYLRTVDEQEAIKELSIVIQRKDEYISELNAKIVILKAMRLPEPAKLNWFQKLFKR